MSWLDNAWQDLRHGARLLIKNPGFTAIAVLSIAFGTGANVAMFSATDALLLRPLPIRHAEGLFTVGMSVSLGPVGETQMSYADFDDVRGRSQTMQSWVAYACGARLHGGRGSRARGGRAKSASGSPSGRPTGACG